MRVQIRLAIGINHIYSIRVLAYLISGAITHTDPYAANRIILAVFHAVLLVFSRLNIFLATL